jgi:hypothetical protein
MVCREGADSKPDSCGWSTFPDAVRSVTYHFEIVLSAQEDTDAEPYDLGI